MKWIFNQGMTKFLCFVIGLLLFNSGITFTHANGLTGFDLVDADANTFIQSINHQDTLELFGYNEISITANTFGTVTKIDFYWNNTFIRSESSAPYCISGDQAGDYNPWVFFDLNLPQQIKAVAYSGSIQIDTIDISVVFVNSGPPRIPGPPKTFSCTNNF